MRVTCPYGWCDEDDRPYCSPAAGTAHDLAYQREERSVAWYAKMRDPKTRWMRLGGGTRVALPDTKARRRVDD